MLCCYIPECGLPVYAREMCKPHYMKWWRHGDPNRKPQRVTRPANMSEGDAFHWFMPGEPPPSSSPTEGCWDWTGSTWPNGYGMLWTKGKHVPAHAVAYRLYGTEPVTEENYCILHSCDRPICCQPAHLRPGTKAQNNQDKIDRGRQTRGEQVHTAKLTEDDVLAIRASNLTHPVLAEMYGVSKINISHIRRGLSWRHLL